MLFLLDANVRTVKWNGIPLHEASSAIVKEEINSDFTLTVRYPITDSGIYQLIKEDMLIKAPTPVLGAQLFRIKKPIENDDNLDITAYHVSDDIMKRSITPVSVVGQGCAMALSQMVQNAKTGLGDFSVTSDIMDSRTFNTTETETLYSVLMDGQHSIVGTWEGELVRDNFALSIKRSRGDDRGVVITTHKNLKSYQRTKNSQGVVTRIHARSTFKPDGAEDEVTLRVTVDSPLINSYPYINEKECENNNAETVEDLRKWAEAKFTNEGIDKVSDAIEIEAYELDGQVVHLGDTVNLKSRKHSVDLNKKAVAYEFNALTEEYISITFDDKPGVGGSSVSSGLSNVADAILGASATAQDVAVERAVKNANAAFDAEFDKRAEKIYDGIEQAKADVEEYADKLKTEITQEFDTFEQEFQATKKSQDQQIADILAKAQANTNLATDAKNIGNQAKIDVANALAQALQYKSEAIAEARRLDVVERQASETKLATAKSQAVAEATQLVNNAKTTLETQISSAKKSIDDAKKVLETQISSVSTELTKTNDTIKTLATKTDIDATNQRVTTAETSLTQQAGQIALKANQSTVDALSGRVKNAETSITQQAGHIALKANTADVNALTNRVSTTEASLKVQSDQIALKASQSDLSNLSTRVSSAESTLQVQAGQIASRVKTSDFDQAKQRLSAAESSITQLDNRITTEITETKALIPTKTSGNMLLKSNIGWTNKHLVKYKLAEPVLAGRQYTAVAKWQSDDSTQVANVGLENTQTDSRTAQWVTLQKDSQSGLWIGTFTASQTVQAGKTFAFATVARDGIGSADWVTLVEGPVALTNWQPNQSELISDIETVKTTITQTAEGQEQLSTRLTETAGKMTAAEATIRQLLTDVSSKVSQMDYNKLKGTVDSQSTLIAQQAGQIALKAEKTLVDNVKSTADSAKLTASDALAKAQANAQSITQAKAELKVATDKIATLVTKTDFSAATGRLSTLETSLEQQAGQIAQRLTSTQVEQAINGRGYQTKAQVDSNITSRGYITSSALQPYATTTTVQNLVTETAGSFERSITETKALIPTTVSHRNLAIGSTENWTDFTSITKNNNWFKKMVDIPFGDSTGVYEGTKVNVYVHISVDDVVLDPSVKPRIILQGPGIRKSDGSDVWGNQYNPIHGKFVDTNLKSGNNYRLIKVSGAVTKDAVETCKAFGVWVRVDGVKSGKFHWRGLTVTTGDVAPDYWTQPIEDTVRQTAFNSVKDTVDAHKRVIGDGSAISQAIQSASKFERSIVAGGDIYQAIETAKGLVSRVSSLSDSQNLVYDPTNYSKYKPKFVSSKLALTGTSEYKLLRITQTGLTSDGWQGFQMPLHSQKFTAGEKLSYRVNIWVDVLPDDVVGFEIKNGSNYIGGFEIRPTKTGSSQIFTGTFTIEKTTMMTDDYGLHVWLKKNGTVAIGQLSIVRGDVPLTSFVDSTSAMQMATESQVSQLNNSWAFRTLNGAGDILSQANLSSAQFLLEAAKIRLKGKTLADEIQAIDGKFSTLFVADGTFGKLNANIIGAQAITGGQIKFDQAFFNNLMANDAYLKQLFAKTAFITQVQSVTMSANQISGGVLKATNNAMQIQLNNGQILYYTDQAALKRVLAGYPTQFIKFATGTVTGKGNAGVTVIGSNRNGTESSNDGGFVGMRAWNGTNIDSLDLVGDTINLASSAFDNADGWDVVTLPNRLEIDAHNANHRVSSRVKVGDVWIWKNSTTYASLKDTINLIIDNLNLIHLNKATEKGYNYTLPAKM